jgi:hypothetical protein
MQTAACNGRHAIEQRFVFARWLLAAVKIRA